MESPRNPAESQDVDLVRIGDNIRDTRRRRSRETGKRITQEELGSRASLHRVRIGEIERGQTGVGVRTLIKIARALEVPAADLLDGIE